MKFALTLAAAGVSGHYRSSQKNLKAVAIDLLYKPITGSHIQDTCDVAPVRMEDWHFVRQLVREGHVSGVEALYGKTDFISDECFGEWMLDMWAPVHEVYEQFKYDFNEVSYEQMENAGVALMDMYFRNNEECQMEKIGDDIKHWCLDNEGTCFRREGWFGRVIDNIFPMLHNTWDALSTLKINNVCSDDAELIHEYATMWGDHCKNIVVIFGMEPEWNNGEAKEHIVQHDFHEEKKAYKKANPKHPMFKLAWETMKAMI